MPQATPCADVIIPTYGPQPGMLAEAIASARSSPLVARVLVIDDGSEPPVRLPGLPAGASPAAADRPVPVELIRQPNAGPAAARNRGLGAATAPWALLLDDDDLLIPAGLAAAIELAEGLGAIGAVAARIERPVGGGPDYLKEAPPEWAGGTLPRRGDVFRPTVLFNGSGILFRRDGPAEGLRFDEGLFVVEDRDFLRRLAALGPIAVSPEPMVIARRRADGSNLTGGRHLHRRIRGHVLLLRRYRDHESEAWLWAQTMWLLNAAAKAGVDRGHWRLLVRAAADAGWVAPRKARLRRVLRPAP
jgi:glycosyltransferase involved in cell wall biosynthesis